MKKKQVYEAPELTVVKFRAERGFAASNGNVAIAFDQLFLSESTENLESRNEVGYWGSSNDNGWF